MRTTLALSALILLLSLSAGFAAEKAAPESVEEVEMRGFIGGACYESDKDLNYVAENSDEEIFQLLNPPRS